MNKPNNAYKPVSILIVDDHALIRKGIMAILKNYNPNWELHEAEDGVKAILKAQEINPDIILLDYLMPRLDGVKAANIIRKARPESKIIMVSMDMSPEIIIEMIDADVAGIVSKHLGDDELLQAVCWATTHDPSEGFKTAIKLFLRKFGYERLVDKI